MSDKSKNESEINQNLVIQYAIQLLALSLLLVWCFRIVEPFITLIVWSGVLAISIYPLHQRLSQRLRGRKTWSAAIITVVMISSLIGPAIWLLFSSVNEFKVLAAAYQSGNFAIPPPAPEVKEWPLVGEATYDLWAEASDNLSKLFEEHKEQVKTIAIGVMNMIAGTGKGIALFLLSIIACGFMLTFATPVSEAARTLFKKLAGKHGDQMIGIAEATVRNVVKGILGVAVIQSLLAGIGLVLAGIPLAGIWIIVCLILSIVQIGVFPVSIGAIIYIWNTANTTTAIVFTIWMLFVGVIDNILKPIMLGKGAPAPMIIVFLGSLGGFVMSGLIGLFTGAIVLSVGYRLINVWLYPEEGSQA